MMMLRRGDLNLNHLAQTGGESVKEGLMQAMVQHEIIFRNQVRELHRLYWTQKNLMRELYSSRKAAVVENDGLLVPSHSPVAGNVGDLRDVKNKFVDIQNNRHRNFNFQLPADEYIRDDRGELVSKRMASEGSIDDELVISLEMAGGNTRETIDEKVGANGSLLNGGSSLYCYEVIDLDESVEMESHERAYAVSSGGFKAPTEKGADMRNESGLVPVVTHLHAGDKEGWREQSTVCSGMSESSAAAFDDLSAYSTKKPQSSSCKPVLIDLNIAQDDESSHLVNDPMLVLPSASSSSSAVQPTLPENTSCTLTRNAACPASKFPREKTSNCFFHGFQDSESSKVTELNTYHEHEGLIKCSRNSVDVFSSGSSGELPNSTNGTSLSSTGLCEPLEENIDLPSGNLHCIVQRHGRRNALVLTCSKDIEDNHPRHASVGSTNLSAIGDAEEKQANHEGSEEDTVSSHVVAQDEKKQDGVVEKFPGGSKVDFSTGNSDCSSQDKSVEDSGTTQVETLVAESGEEKTCKIGRSKLKEYIQDQAEKLDQTFVSAVEALVHISLTGSSPVEQFESTVQSETEIEEDSSDQPQYSSDSYELMTLKLIEIKNDEPSMPTRPTEKEAGNCTGGVKLRRGRGRRDFQKDILPGLVSLSRHEICEDLNIIGYNLRKNRASRKACGDNWSVPVRSRRSRLYSVGRRC